MLRPVPAGLSAQGARGPTLPSAAQRRPGRTTELTPGARAAVAALLTPLGPGHPWPEVLPTTRWGRPGPPTIYTQVRPEVVVEVVDDTAVEHHRWRHAARFVRLRPDLKATDLAPPSPADPTADDARARRSSG